MSSILERTRQYIEQTGISQAKLAGKIGVAESTFSRVIKGNYPNPEAVEKKIEEYLEKQSRRSSSVKRDDIDFVSTTISEKVEGVLEYCRVQKNIGCIYGDAAVGKTYTATHWANNKSDVSIVTANPAFATPKPFMKLLARDLRTTMVGGMDDILLEIIDRLESSDRMLIVDEAQHLTRKTLEVIRSLNDIAGTAIVLIGNELIYSKMQGRQKAEFAQLFSRIGMSSCVMTDSFTLEDVHGVLGELDKRSSEYMLRVCQSKYGLRGAVALFANAANNDDVSQKGLKAMAEAMGIVL